MRVEPELPDHPKYLRLKRLVGDFAMEALMRIWAHCQQNQRGAHWPGADAEYLEMIAKWDGEPGLLYRSLTDPKIRFVDVIEGGLLIHDWEEMNKQIVKNWENGRDGGRPKNKAISEARNPLKTQRLTSGETQTQIGLAAISGDEARNPVVNPIPVSVNPVETQHKPNQRNVTELNETTQDGTERVEGRGSRVEGGMRYDLALEVIHFLNEQTGAEFKGTRSEIEAAAVCLASVGNDFEGIKKMVARQVALWSAVPKTAAWLQPRTLFDEEKFPGYFAMRNLPTDNATTDPVARRRELEEAIGTHPANRHSVFHRPDCTEEQKQQLKTLREEQAALGKKTPASSNA